MICVGPVTPDFLRWILPLPGVHESESTWGLNDRIANFQDIRHANFRGFFLHWLVCVRQIPPSAIVLASLTFCAEGVKSLS